MKVLKRIFIGAIILISLAFHIFVIKFGALCVEIAWEYATGNVDITNIPKAYAISITYTVKPDMDKGVSNYEETENEAETVTELQWYDTVEEALQNDELLQDEKSYENLFKRHTVTEITRVALDDTLVIFYMPLYTPEEKQAQRRYEKVAVFSFIQFKIDEGRISQPYYVDYELRDVNYHNWRASFYCYDCDDAVICFMERKLISDMYLEEKENRIPIYFGVWENKEEIESLTVLGEKPEIVCIDAGGDLYYFWYFTDIDRINEKLLEVNWKDYNYGQIIELLEIKYDKAETEEN